MTLRPVCSGTLTGARSMIAAAGRSIGRRALDATGPLPSSGRPSGSMTRPSKPFADRHIHDATGALDAIARVQVRVVAEQHDTDIVLVEIEGDAEHIAGKRKQFVGACMRKARDARDSGGNARDRADFLRRRVRGAKRSLASPISRMARSTVFAQICRFGNHAALDLSARTDDACKDLRGMRPAAAAYHVRPLACAVECRRGVHLPGVARSLAMRRFPSSSDCRYASMFQATICPLALSSIPQTSSGLVSKRGGASTANEFLHARSASPPAARMTGRMRCLRSAGSTRRPGRRRGPPSPVPPARRGAARESRPCSIRGRPWRDPAAPCA